MQRSKRHSRFDRLVGRPDKGSGTVTPSALVDELTHHYWFAIKIKRLGGLRRVTTNSPPTSFLSSRIYSALATRL
jgi:hypothetical protein